MTKKLTILVTPMEGVGHVNASIGIAVPLRERGHRIIFVVNKSYEGRLLRYGFEEEILEESDQKIGESDKKPGEEAALRLMTSGILKGMSSLQKMELMMSGDMFNQLVEKNKTFESQRKAIVEKYNPDIILMDEVIGSPSFIYSGIPWVLIVSTNPLYLIEDGRTPPGGSGYPTNGDKSEWNIFKQVKDKGEDGCRLLYNEWMSELGLPQLTNNRIICIPYSPYLNIYGFPEELDYTDIRPMPDKWFRVDCFTRKGEQDFKLPESFEKRDKEKQKLIYLSLGSMGSVDIELMKNLVNILSKSPHKYIVSKGLLGDKYELPDNMWGENSVPQTKVLPLVDLVITHGGNNTVTETFSFGKPMIVMPLFADQFDNAQRIHEKGFGVRIEPHSCTEEVLLEAIEKLLNDNNLKERLDLAANRITQFNSLVRVSEEIEKLVY